MQNLLLLAISAAIVSTASGQQIQGRIYPNQSSYMVGEPLFFTLEIKNVGPEPVHMFPKGAGDCSDVFHFTVHKVTAKGTASTCEKTWDTHCQDEPFDLDPGDSYEPRWPLDFWYRIEEPGEYKASISRHFEFSSGGARLQQWNVASDLDFKIVSADPAQIESAMRKFEADIRSKDMGVRHPALDAMAATAPVYMRDTILRLAHDDDIFNVEHAIAALRRLNIPEGRAALADIITTRKASTEQELVQRCNAIQVLGVSGDSSYITLLAPYMEHESPESTCAMNAIALLGRANAVEQIQRFLQSPSLTLRENAATALRYTSAPQAVDVLISALRDKDEAVRSEALTSLEQLTGHSVSGPSTSSPLQLENQWRTWWNAHRDTNLGELTSDICRM